MYLCWPSSYSVAKGDLIFWSSHFHFPRARIEGMKHHACLVYAICEGKPTASSMPPTKGIDILRGRPTAEGLKQSGFRSNITINKHINIFSSCVWRHLSVILVTQEVKKNDYKVVQCGQCIKTLSLNKVYTKLGRRQLGDGWICSSASYVWSLGSISHTA